MAKRHTFRKTKTGKLIPITAREFESFMLEYLSTIGLHAFNDAISRINFWNGRLKSSLLCYRQ